MVKHADKNWIILLLFHHLAPFFVRRNAVSRDRNYDLYFIGTFC